MRRVRYLVPMVTSQEMPPTSEWSRSFSGALTAYVDNMRISRQKVAEDIGRSRSFVSDQLLGKRPVDTDVISGIAKQAKVQPSTIVRQVLTEMKRAATPPRTPKVIGEAPRGRAKRDHSA